MLWDNRALKGNIVETGLYTLTCKFESQLYNYSCHITGVYGPNFYIKRRSVWEELGAIRGIIKGPWAVCGDFNVVRFISERRNCERRTRVMKESSDVIEDLNLVNLQLEDNNYMWFKGDNLEATSRIDGILISEKWDDNFNNIRQSVLQRLISDHSPVALQGDVWNKKKKHFKFENWWLGIDGIEGFTDRINSWWHSFNFSGRRDFILVLKLKALKTKLKD